MVARLLFPDEGSRLAYRVSASTLRSVSAGNVTVYTDAEGTVLADLREYDGTNTPGPVIAGSVVTTDQYSRLPLFWGPDAIDTLYAVIYGGPPAPVYSRVDDRLDTIDASMALKVAKGELLKTVKDYGAINDCVQPGQTISLVSGSPIATLSSALSGLAAGHTVVVSGTVLGTGLALADVGDTVTLTTHGMTNGQTVTLSNIVTATGVSPGTVYYVIGATADTFQLSLTSGGAVVDITSAGTATVTRGDTATYDVSSVAGTSVVLTTNASVTASGLKFIYGTDNTTAFNAFFAACLTGVVGFVPDGAFLITGTVGILEPGEAVGNQGLTVLWGGAGVNTMHLGYTGVVGGATSMVWGGAAGGTMMQFARVSFVNFIGGLTLVGQACHAPSGVFTTFGPRAGVGLHLSQLSTPWTGTGYLSLGDVVFSDVTLGLLFGTLFTDNNCDTTLANRLVFWRCTNGLEVRHLQGLGYRFNWIHAVEVPGSVVKCSGGGALEIGSLHLSLCGTASGDPFADTYCVDLDSGVNGYSFKIALMRIEGDTVRAVAVRSADTHLQIGMFTEANNASTDKAIFLVRGTLQINGGRILSQKFTGEATFSMENDVNSRAPRLVLSEVALPSTASGFPSWASLFSIDPNCVMDVSLVGARWEQEQIAFQDRHSRLERGPVLIGGPTTDAVTATRLDPMFRLGGTAWVYSYGPRLPKGLSVVQMTLTGERADTASASVFRRIYTLFRNNDGTCTVLNTETLGVDQVQGTDQLFFFGVTPTFFTLDLQVKGTAAVTVDWRAYFNLLSHSTTIPDY